MPISLKQKRLIFGYTQKEMAKMLDISYFSYNQKEKENSKWNLQEAKKLKIIFNLTPEEVIYYFFN